MRKRTEEERQLQAEENLLRRAGTPTRRYPFGTRVISSSDGTYLRFESPEEWETYEAAICEAEMQHYHQARVRYGVWASNQDRYVASADLFNQHDNRCMEHRYAAWLAKQPKER